MGLLELAEKLEAAGADEQRELLLLALKHCRPIIFSLGMANSFYEWFVRKLDAEAYVDAALMLVPEGRQTGFEMPGKFDGRRIAEAWCWPWDSNFEPDWQLGQQGYRDAPDATRSFAATPALAIAAASLRALAYQEMKDV